MPNLNTIFYAKEDFYKHKEEIGNEGKRYKKTTTKKHKLFNFISVHENTPCTYQNGIFFH